MIRASQGVVGRAEMEALSGPEMGAVLELPFQTATDADLGQPALLRAVYHGHPTTALPRGNPRPDPALKKLLRPALAAPTHALAMAELQKAGVSAVILDTRAQGEGRSPTTTTLKYRLGEPARAGHLLIWTAGPARAKCLPGAPPNAPKPPSRGTKSPPPRDGKAGKSPPPRDGKGGKSPPPRDRGKPPLP